MPTRIYSYRPPRLTVAQPNRPRKDFKKLLLGFGVTLCGIGFGLYFNSNPTLLEAVVSTESNSVARTASAVEAHVSIQKVIPFLKTPTMKFKLFATEQPKQAIGGGPGLLKEAFGLKGGVSANFETGEIYYAANADRRMPIASITKVMTAMVALDLASLDEQFVVHEAATKVEPTVMGIRTGEKLTNRELLKAGLLTSANDAMAVVAESIGKKYGGDSSLFVEAMNKKAELIGLKNTHFANPQGYDDAQHYSTAEDLVVMARYALTNYPEIERIVAEKEDSLTENATHHDFKLPNWNMLLGTYPGAKGIKIGNTGDAGHTTLALAERNGVKIVVVVLGADGILKRDLSAAELLNVGFSYNEISPFNMTEELLRTRIKDWY